MAKRMYESARIRPTYGSAEFARGYWKAAQRSIGDLRRLLRSGDFVAVDTEINPALYNVRHAVELTLKEILHSLGPKDRAPAKVPKVHDLSQLSWLVDSGLNRSGNPSIPAEVLREISLLNDLDPRGISFRYPDAFHDPGEELFVELSRLQQITQVIRPWAEAVLAPLKAKEDPHAGRRIRNELRSLREALPRRPLYPSTWEEFGGEFDAHARLVLQASVDDSASPFLTDLLIDFGIILALQCEY
jgi:HEPN domain-containing protein